MKRVLFRPAAIKDLDGLQDRDRNILEAAIERFARTGQGDVKKLSGAERDMRLRAGDWRIRWSSTRRTPSAFCTSGIAATLTVNPTRGWVEIGRGRCRNRTNLTAQPTPPP